VAVALDPTFVSVSNLLCVTSFSAIFAPVGVYIILDAGVTCAEISIPSKNG
jgi:hypothetical protein